MDALDTKIVAAVKIDDRPDLAAWIGITPRSNSGSGKERLGRISKRGNKQLRTLLIVGATAILKQARRGLQVPTTALHAEEPC